MLLATGDAGDPEALGTVPPNVHVERFWPQRDVMPHASAMVAHGGLSTTLVALSAGVPMLLLPIFADQPFDADRVLGETSLRDGAAAVAEEIAGLPPVSRAVAVLEHAASTTMGG